jgi:hypothetical protein
VEIPPAACGRGCFLALGLEMLPVEQHCHFHFLHAFVLQILDGSGQAEAILRSRGGGVKSGSPKKNDDERGAQPS